MKKILIVEDHSKTLLIMKAILETKFPSWCIKTATTGEASLLIINQFIPDLILLDRNLPDISGDTICEYIRSNKYPDDPYICMITAAYSSEEKIEGYVLGVDEYICKPIDYKELPFRLNAVIQRSNRRKKQSEPGAFPIQTKFLEVMSNGQGILKNKQNQEIKKIHFTECEQKILEILIESSGLFVSRERIAHELWDVVHSLDIVSTNIYRIKKKLSPMQSIIKSQRGLGYCFDTASVAN